MGFFSPPNRRVFGVMLVRVASGALREAEGGMSVTGTSRRWLRLETMNRGVVNLRGGRGNGEGCIKQGGSQSSFICRDSEP